VVISGIISAYRNIIYIYGNYSWHVHGKEAAPAIIGYIIGGGLGIYLCYALKLAIIAFGDLVSNSSEQKEYLKIISERKDNDNSDL
jgi:hypothetical protein